MEVCLICLENKCNINILEHINQIGDISLHKMCNECCKKYTKDACPFCNCKIINKNICMNQNKEHNINPTNYNVLRIMNGLRNMSFSN